MNRSWFKNDNPMHQRSLSEADNDLNKSIIDETGNLADNVSIDEDLEAFFHEIQLLNNIPIRYLIPNAKIVPEESFRLFQIDQNWIEAVIDGICSVARIEPSDLGATLSNLSRRSVAKYRSRLLHKDVSNFKATDVKDFDSTGFILHSRMVKEYPGLEIQGKDASGNALTLLRYERLEADMALVIFQGNLKTVVLRVPHESRSYGFDQESDGLCQISKKSFDDGSIINDDYITIKTKNNRKIDVQDFIKNGLIGVEKAHSGHFALSFLQVNKEVTISYGDK
jgi:hypothetical protein